MKARKLKQILNNTGYHVHKSGNKICVGSPMCSDLISVDMGSFKIRYALDTFNKGRECLAAEGQSDSKKQLLFIWDKLVELIESGELSNIWAGNDELETPLPVYYVKDGEVVETYTDAYGWPNVTFDGEMMFNNTHFNERRDAIQYGVKDSELAVKYLTESIEAKRKELERLGIECLKALEERKKYKALLG